MFVPLIQVWTHVVTWFPANRSQATHRLRGARDQCFFCETGADRPMPQQSELDTVEDRVNEALKQGQFTSKAGSVQLTQNDLFTRFKLKYGGDSFDCRLTPERQQLLNAIGSGDVDAIRALLETADWNFVYPPETLDKTLRTEAWCRTPLTLLVRPDEGNFTPMMRGVSKHARHLLIEEVLVSGKADPNFPSKYWGSPAVHAAFEGDVDALKMLRCHGCDLSACCEWLLQDEPLFSLVHAAAFNGQLDVLRYLHENEHTKPLFQAVDADGSNALHTLLESSCDLEAARFLLEAGTDGYALNKLGRSPLSTAVAKLPELALELLRSKSRFEYRWWGDALYWYSYSGVVLPADEPDGKLSPLARSKPEVDSALTFLDLHDHPATLEELILKHERKELLETPIMYDIIETKWACFARAASLAHLFTFVAMAVAVFVICVCEPGSPLFYVASVVAVGAYTRFSFKEFVKRFCEGRQVRDVRRYGSEVQGGAGGATTAITRFGFKNSRVKHSAAANALASANIVLVPLVVGASVLGALGAFDESSASAAALAALAGALQVTFAIGILYFAAGCSPVFGPLLVQVPTCRVHHTPHTLQTLTPGLGHPGIPDGLRRDAVPRRARCGDCRVRKRLLCTGALRARRARGSPRKVGGQLLVRQHPH